MNNKIFKKPLVIGMICTSLLVFTGCTKEKVKNEDESIVATMNGLEFTKEELYKELVEQNGTSALERLITEEIVKQESKKNNIKISDKEIEKTVKEEEAKYGGVDEYKKMLSSQGVTMKEIEDNVTYFLTLKKLLEKEMNVTDEELKAHFEEKKDSYNTPEQVKASHILVKDEETAKKVKGLIDSGTPFEEVAKEFSTDESNKTTGGDLGYFKKGDMVDTFDAKVFQMKVGEVSEPVKTQFGYHIILLVDKKPAQKANFEQMKETVKEEMLQQKLETEYPKWVEKKFEEYKVETYLEKP